VPAGGELPAPLVHRARHHRGFLREEPGIGLLRRASRAGELLGARDHGGQDLLEHAHKEILRELQSGQPATTLGERPEPRDSAGKAINVSKPAFVRIWEYSYHNFTTIFWRRGA
jgi:hypothetical protein